MVTISADEETETWKQREESCASLAHWVEKFTEILKENDQMRKVIEGKLEKIKNLRMLILDGSVLFSDEDMRMIASCFEGDYDIEEKIKHISREPSQTERTKLLVQIKTRFDLRIAHFKEQIACLEEHRARNNAMITMLNGMISTRS